MHDTIIAKVVKRYLAAFTSLTAVDRGMVPPKGVVNGVETGELPREVLNIWKYVVERLGDRFAYDAATKYWRNKCARMGIVLPEKYVKAMGGEGGAGRWGVAPGDQIEEWVREQLKSEGMLDNLGRSVYDWRLWIEHYEHEVDRVLALIDKHTRALSSAKSDKGMAQRQKWLEGARKELAKQTDELEKARKAMTDLIAAAQRYGQSKSPTIEFEKEFQFLILLALKEFDKEAVRQAVQTALDRVEQGISIPGDEEAFNVERYEPGFKAAGLFETLGKAWNYLVDKFDQFVNWVSGLLRIGKKMDALMDAAGA